MKKILTTLSCAAILVTTASADLARVEMGVGAWMQTPSGELSYTESGVTAIDNSNEKEETSGYVWMLIKHPVPIIPNLRVEYVDVKNTGKATGKFKDFDIPLTAKASTTLTMTQYDVIPYYNILDNTFWTTVDLGLDLKIIEASYDVDNAIDNTTGTVIPGTAYSDSESTVIPLAYLRARVEIPSTDIGLEADVKYVSYDGSTIYEVRAKIDYTLDFIPVIQPAIEVGYRVQKFDIDDDSAGDVKIDLEFSGVYAGVMLRF